MPSSFGDSRADHFGFECHQYLIDETTTLA